LRSKSLRGNTVGRRSKQTEHGDILK
jgi:hypothetical protein